MDRGSWRPVRDLYITVTFKMKTTTEFDEVTGEKSLVLLPKNIEISQLKVLKDNEEEQMEQMMIQSMANVQLEQAKKLFKKEPFPVSKLLRKQYKELQCFGFMLSDLDL